MYESFYNLNANPFLLSPDPDLFYGSRGHRRALAYLQYGLAQGEGFIVITGQVGTGKTMLVHALFNEIEEQDYVSAKLVTTQLDEDQMLMMVAESFGINCEGNGKAKILGKLREFLAQQRVNGKRALLVVDEAQNIPKKSLEELRMLSNIQVSGKPLLQTFLLGQQEFSQTLYAPDMVQLLQRVIATYHLKPLGMDEVKSYIQCRLSHVGWSGDPEFSDDAFKAIFSYTEGIPRRINTLCNRVLLYGYLEDIHQFSDETILSVIRELDDEIPAVKNNEASTVETLFDSRVDEIEQRLARLEDGVRIERERIRKALALMVNRVKS